MKKLKPWQIVLLVIFYPIGIIYLIVWLVKRGKAKAKQENEKNLTPLRVMTFNVVGCIYPNEDGTSRQTYIINLKPGDELRIKPAPTEEYPDSIGVFTLGGGQIGVMPYKTLNELRGMYAHNRASLVVENVIHSERGLGVSATMKIYN